MRVKKGPIQDLTTHELEALQSSLAVFEDVGEMEKIVQTRKSMVSEKYHLEIEQVLSLLAKCHFSMPNDSQCKRYGITTSEDLISDELSKAINVSFFGEDPEMFVQAVILCEDLVTVHFVDNSVQAILLKPKDGFPSLSLKAIGKK